MQDQPDGLVDTSVVVGLVAVEQASPYRAGARRSVARDFFVPNGIRVAPWPAAPLDGRRAIVRPGRASTAVVMHCQAAWSWSV
jgi:hypothetical protein